MQKPLLIAMCGLPGSGKSTLSRRLAQQVGALRWDKDELRHLLFPPRAVEHDRALNDLCMDLLYAAAQYALTQASLCVPVVILDGRPAVSILISLPSKGSNAAFVHRILRVPTSPPTEMQPSSID